MTFSAEAENHGPVNWVDFYTAMHKGSLRRITLIDDGLQRDGKTYRTRIAINVPGRRDTFVEFDRALADRLGYAKVRWLDVYDHLREIGVDVGTLRACRGSDDDHRV